MGPFGCGDGKIRFWGFRHNKLADLTCQLLTTALQNNLLHCAAWDLRTNKFTAAGCESLACITLKNPNPAFESMLVARLGCNHLGDEGVKVLAHGMSKSLQILDLKQAHFGDAGAEAIAHALRNNYGVSLQELHVSGNEIGPLGGQQLAKGWGTSVALNFVDLANNPLGSEGVTLIADELPSWHQSPFHLSLCGVGCEDAGMTRLHEVLQANDRRSHKWTIDLGNNTVQSVSLLCGISAALAPVSRPSSKGSHASDGVNA